MKRPALALLVLTALAGAMLLAGSGTEAAGTFNPTTDVELSDYNSDANATMTTSFNVPAGDYNYSEMVAFTPPEFYVASAGDVPIGTEVGTLSNLVTLGLINGPCSTPLPVSFTLLNCSTDTGDTVSFDDGFLDVNPASGIPDGCDKYPDFLNTVYPGITPRARMYGQTVVVGTDVSLNFVVFESGQAVPGVPSLGGYPAVTVLNDPTAPLEPSAITDFCAPLSTDVVIYGLADGSEVRRNPPYGGTYTFHWFTRSVRDADGDGLSNDMDTCPFDPNTGSDADNDHIDDACDLDVPKAKGNDVDGDLYWNRQDNCPQVANPDQHDADRDDIGDACDTEGNGPDVPDGDAIEVTFEVDVEIGEPPPTPTPTPTPNTPIGSDVTVPLNGGLGQVAGVQVTFSSVSGGGNTTVTTSTAGPPPPTGFRIVGLAGQPLYFDINTDASYSGDLTVCVRYDETQVAGSEANLKLMQRVDGFVDVTTSVDTANNMICGTTTHLSVFVVAEALAAVGGIVEMQVDGSNSAVGSAADSPGGSAVPYHIALAAAAAAGAIVVAAGALYARRRRLR